MGVEVNLQDDVSLFVGTLILSFCKLLPIRCHVTINTRDILMNTLFQSDATDVCVLFCFPFQALWTPLHIAASAGREDIVRSLISKGAQLNSVNQNGCTPLHYAASKDRYEVTSTGCSISPPYFCSQLIQLCYLPV